MNDTFLQILLVIALCAVAVYALHKGGIIGTSVSTPSARARKNTQDLPFTRDFTQMARTGAIDPFSGREAEIDRVIHIILRRTKNNPLLIGEPGVGKSAIVEGLALRMVSGDVPDALKDKRLLALDLNALMSGTSLRGELEKRLQAVTHMIEESVRSLILFIDEIHLLEQVGRSEGSLSISDVLKPALARGDVSIIGATTWSEYQEHIRADAALDRRLQPVLVDEPSQEQAMKILKSLRPEYEKFHGVKITDAAIKAAVRLSDEKIEKRFLPDKAIDLIDEASSKVSIDAHCNRMVPAGVVHTAAKAAGKGCTVTEKEIGDVVDQWVIHSKEEAKRDARKM